MINSILIAIASFVGVWIGSGIAIKAIEHISRRLKVSQFAISFLLLGFFTSITEFSVGINSVINGDPEIFVGNVIGGTMVVLLMIVPLLALFGKPIKITPEFRGFNLKASLITAAAPAVLVLDGKVDGRDSLVAISLFLLLSLSIQTKKSIVEQIGSLGRKGHYALGKELIKVIFGLAIVFTASRFLVQQTLYFSEIFGISSFLISLLVISVGTNAPELSMVVRSVAMKKYQVAFGNYIGSISFNTFFFGLLSMLYGQPIYLTNSFLVSLLFLIFGLLLFYYFSKTKNTISRTEGVILLAFYVAFVLTEIVVHKDLFI